MIKPSVGVATEAYQVLLELHRQHPEDEDLVEHLQQAWRLLEHVHAEHVERKRRAL